MSNWTRLAYPPTRWIVLAFALIGVFDLCVLGLWSFDGADVTREVSRLLNGPIALLIVFSGAGLAGFRLTRLPLSNSPAGGYDEWLAATPWQNSQRLPFGPWQPILFDLVPLGILGAVSLAHGWIAGLESLSFALLFALSPAIGFVLVWSIGGYMMVHTKWAGSKPVLALWLSGACHVFANAVAYQSPILSMELYLTASLAVGFVLVWRKLASELRKFPEQYHGQTETTGNASHATIGTYRVLAPGYRPVFGFGEIAQRYRSLPGAALIALLGFSYCSLFAVDDTALIGSMAIVILIGFIAMALFIFDRYPNLGLAARWSRRELLVPAYDRVALIFLAVVASGGIVVAAGMLGLLSATVAGPASIAVALFVALQLGKDQREWSLTTPCRHALVKSRYSTV